MKVKQRPEDFVVLEELDLVPQAAGEFGLYLLRKSGLGTFEALDRLCRRERLRRADVGYAGLKDRHALTEQTVSIRGRPLGALAEPGLELLPLGRSDRPVETARLARNRYRVTLRDLSRPEAAAARARLARLAELGLPNYFDDQRFGSLRGADEFIARRLIDERYDEALKLAVAAPGPGDHGELKRQKQSLAQRWGDWPACLAALAPHDPARGAFAYLVEHPGGFVGAFERLPEGLRRLYLYAYQSYVWNRAAAGLIREAAPAGKADALAGRAGELVFYDELEPETLARLRALELPLPTHRLKERETPGARAVAAALAGEGLDFDRFRIRRMPQTYFRRGARLLLVFPQAVEAAAPADDELNPGRTALELRFALPPGAYATILIKDVSRSFWRGPPGRNRPRPFRRGAPASAASPAATGLTPAEAPDADAAPEDGADDEA